MNLTSCALSHLGRCPTLILQIPRRTNNSRTNLLNAASSGLLLSSSPLLLLLNRDPRRTVFSVGPQPRPSTPSVPCRTSTTTIPAQCSLPDLNHDHPRPVFPAGPQPRVSTPSVPCRTSCRKIWDKECAEES